MTPFSYRNPTRIHFGVGAIGQLPDVLRAAGIQHALLACDPGIIQAGLLERTTRILAAAQIPHSIFSDIQSDPDVRSVRAGAELARTQGCDGVIGLGGGSVMDVAKAIGTMLANPGDISDYFGVDQIPNRAAPVVAIPTTAGTGSEVTVWSVLSDSEHNRKVNVGSEKNSAHTALLDPELSLRLPPAVTAATGMDALTHAIESLVNKACHPLAAAQAEKAIELIGAHLRHAVLRGDDLQARSQMLVGSTLAGLAFNRIRLGLAHAFALPLGNGFHISHGLVNAIMLTPVMQYNVPANVAGYARVARLLGEDTHGISERAAAERAVAAVQGLKKDIGLTQTLADFGVAEQHFDAVIKEAMTSGNIPVNPRTPNHEDMRLLLRQAMNGTV
ncbi:MAG: iron-containing alcohol dehydrogenase [Burkholderiaceae bacterium]|uniref:iron-containing alcohol dehydrogenase n=1 Tax=Castellaniella sp. TaxID=1955812 RepID=UPI003560A31C